MRISLIKTSGHFWLSMKENSKGGDWKAFARMELPIRASRMRNSPLMIMRATLIGYKAKQGPILSNK